MTEITLVSDGQIRQISRVASDAAEKAVRDFMEEHNPDRDVAQAAFVRGNELADAIRATVTKTLTAIILPPQYEGEEVRSTYGYYSGYKQPKDVALQSNRLRELFPGLGYHDETAGNMAVPAGAEGLFVIPRWQAFAKLHNVATYAECVVIVLAKLSETRKGRFHNYRANEMDAEHLRETAWKVEAMSKLAEAQRNADLLVIPAQFGLAHRGRSVRRARVVIGTKGFGLGAFEAACMLLTHPERLAHVNDLFIDCAGDEFRPGGEREFSRAPCFNFGGVVDDGLRFDALRVDGADERCGSASAVFPQ